MIGSAIFLKVLDFFKSIALKDFRIFVIFVEGLLCFWFAAENQRLQMDNKALINTFLEFKDRVILKGEEYNRLDRLREKEFRELYEARIEDIKQIQENKKEIRELKK